LIDNRSIWSIARILVRTHGENAVSSINQYTADACSKLDRQGALTWRQIITAVRALQCLQLDEGDRRN
jgi:hypothetical protein